ncbi:hypothetical protein JZM36_06325 [Acinetobacter pittii]|uniref:hypothetical protein n=1 Tax=Acinetobacter pittii TaxID=48296 RepID=UPI00198124B4|nr:hypothetical protein [Acinetobacter pittii]MBN6516486.1 hypothetical protein [Acinetobacter pittii]
MNGYLKIGAVLPANGNYKKLADISLLPSLLIDGLVAGYSLKENTAFNFATGLNSELVGSQPVKGTNGRFVNSSAYIDTGIQKSESFTYLVIAPRTATLGGFLMGDYVHSTLSGNGKEQGTSLSSRGDVYAGVPTGLAQAFGAQASNVSDVLTLFIYSCTKLGASSFLQTYANLQGGRDIFLEKSATDLVNVVSNTVGIGWNKKAATLNWDVNQREVSYACLYNRGFTQAELQSWASKIRQELLNLKNLVI